VIEHEPAGPESPGTWVPESPGDSGEDEDDEE
jgi:hypothetical protein